MRLRSTSSLRPFAPRNTTGVQVVEMRFFGGLTVEETAAMLKISSVTVKRDWSAAKIWLYRELTGLSKGEGLRRDRERTL